MLPWLTEIRENVETRIWLAQDQLTLWQRGLRATQVCDRHGVPYWLFIDPSRRSKTFKFRLQTTRWSWYPQIGFCIVTEKEPGVLFVCDTIVFDKHQSRGLGTVLVQAMISWAKMHHYQRISGIIVPEYRGGTSHLISFWQRQGFQVFEEGHMQIQYFLRSSQPIAAKD